MRHDLDDDGDLTLTIRVPRTAWRELVAAIAKEMGTSVGAEVKAQMEGVAVPSQRPARVPSTAPVYVDAKELARMMSLSVAGVRLWAHRPGFPVVRFGRAVRFKLDDVMAWCEGERTFEAKRRRR